jgi:hypothetical protein
MISMLFETAAVLLCPILAGGLFGVILRRRVLRRLAGPLALASSLVVPAVLAAAITIVFPLVGLWDAILFGAQFGIGLVWTSHRAFADPRAMPLVLLVILFGLVLIEVGARLRFRVPPAYPSEVEGPHLLLGRMLRAISPDSPVFQIEGIPRLVQRVALRTNVDMTMTGRPPSTMLMGEIVCSIAYGAGYHGVVDVSRERQEVFPDPVPTRVGASRRVLHVGDSMVYGANVLRNETFAADLERLEPQVQHLNGGVSGTSPDDYLVLVESWVKRVPVDRVVMYLFAGNDLINLDMPHPCSGWESLLNYEDGRAHLRLASPASGAQQIGLHWLLINSPPPYIDRVLIEAHSTAAAFLGSIMTEWNQRAGWGRDREITYAHVEDILRTVSEELRSRHIAFTVVVLPQAGNIDTEGPSEELSSLTRGIAKKLEIDELDATELLRDSLARGEHPIQPDNTHFTPEGHLLMAKWLHEHLDREPLVREQ